MRADTQNQFLCQVPYGTRQRPLDLWKIGVDAISARGNRHRDYRPGSSRRAGRRRLRDGRVGCPYASVGHIVSEQDRPSDFMMEVASPCSAQTDTGAKRDDHSALWSQDAIDHRRSGLSLKHSRRALSSFRSTCAPAPVPRCDFLTLPLRGAVRAAPPPKPHKRLSSGRVLRIGQNDRCAPSPYEATGGLKARHRVFSPLFPPTPPEAPWPLPSSLPTVRPCASKESPTMMHLLFGRLNTILAISEILGRRRRSTIPRYTSLEGKRDHVRQRQ